MTALRNDFYNAKLIGYKLGNDKNKNPRPQLQFSLEVGDGSFQSAWWDGNFLNDVGIDIALKTLAVCGLKNTDDIERLSEGVPSGILRTDKDYRVKVVIEVDPNRPNRSYTKIKGVYENNGDAPKSMSKEDASVALSSLNLAASFAKVTQELGLKDEPAQPEEKAVVPF